LLQRVRVIPIAPAGGNETAVAQGLIRIRTQTEWLSSILAGRDFRPCGHVGLMRDHGTVSSRSIESISVESMAAGFSALGEPIRLRILGELTDGPRCVCDLLESVGIAPNLLSYHLRVLREAGLVEGSRRGRWIDYRLADDELAKLRAAIPSERGA
jgi:ArsR family transcriptional regulator